MPRRRANESASQNALTGLPPQSQVRKGAQTASAGCGRFATLEFERERLDRRRSLAGRLRAQRMALQGKRRASFRGLMLVLICVNANLDVEDSVSSSGYSQGAWQ